MHFFISTIAQFNLFSEHISLDEISSESDVDTKQNQNAKNSKLKEVKSKRHKNAGKIVFNSMRESNRLVHNAAQSQLDLHFLIQLQVDYLISSIQTAFHKQLHI